MPHNDVIVLILCLRRLFGGAAGPRHAGGPRRRAQRWSAGLALAVLAGCQTPPLVSPSPPPTSPGASSPALGESPAASSPGLPLPLPPAAVPRPPRIGLALGGGAARGFAHIGVLQVLEENGIRPALVVGTSAGSLVAALYAAGNSPRDLGVLAKTMDETAFNDWSYPGRGLFRGAALAQYVRDHAHGHDMEHMVLPLGIVATDLDSGAPVLFQRGDPGVAVRASSAVPAVFQPVKIGTREYVDGGLVSPVPVRFARQMGAELVIAVDISSPPDGNATGDAFHLLLQTFSIMGRSINTWELKDADVVIRPALAKVASSDFTSRAQSIQAGRAAATAALADLRTRIAAKTR